MAKHPISPKCNRKDHTACNGWASVDRDYGNTPCWCDCHDTEEGK